MIPRESSNRCETNMTGSTTFTISAGAEMFKLLSSGLYSNKERAIIREISCNAFDANVDNGKRNIPIKVNLPNAIEPYFIVKDEGKGLSHEEMINIYTQYGNSTKRNRNDQIGSLGLGSKSPFSYCDSFTITSIHKGYKRTYSCFLDSNGAPTLQPFGEEKTNEASGMEVIIPVKQTHFDKFKREAEEVYRTFEVKPEVKGNPKYNVEDYDIIIQSSTKKDWEIIKPIRVGYSTSNIRVAAQGNIEYPINTSVIMPYLNDEEKKLLTTSFRLYFNLGELDFSPSREELGYDDITIENIVSKIKKIIKELKIQIEKDLEKCDSYIEACIKKQELTKNNAFLRSIKTYYKGKQTTNSISLKGNSYYSMNWKGHITKGKRNEDFLTITKNIVGVYNDEGGRKVVPKVKKYIKDNENAIVIVSEYKTFFEDFPNYLVSSQMEKEKRITSKKVDELAYFKKFNNSSFAEYQWKGPQLTPYEVGLDIDEEFFYVPLYRGKGPQEVKYYYQIAGILGLDIKDVYGVSETFIKTKKFKELKSVDFFEYLETYIRSSKEFKNILSSYKYKDFIYMCKTNAYFKYAVEEVDSLYDSVMKKTIKKYKKIKNIDNDGINTVINMARILNIKFDNYQDKSFDEVIETYPLLNNIQYATNKKDIIEYIKAIDYVNLYKNNTANTTTKKDSINE